MSKLLWQFLISLLLITMTNTLMAIEIPKIKKEKPPAKLDENSLSTVMMIDKHGYTAEVHEVNTEDGYILELHRIPKSRDGNTPTKNHPVLIPNCLLGSSADWVLTGPDRSLPMQLADDGFDVWLANYRGNTYSKKHKTRPDNKYDFWNFSLHELGVYDLPAIIDFILNATNTHQLHYIGYSMSTTTFFIFASEKQEYQEKIRSNINLAPIANIYNSTSFFKTLGPLTESMNSICRYTNYGKFSIDSNIIQNILKMVCKSNAKNKNVCFKLLMDVAFGKDPQNFDEESISLIFGHYPAGTSCKLIKHYVQFLITDTFGQYNYKKKNSSHYSSEHPPTYNLKSIHVPTFLFYAENDLLTNPKDVEKLKLQLSNIKEVVKVNNEYFNHLDFIFSKTVTQQINDPVKKILQEMDTKEQENR